MGRSVCISSCWSIEGGRYWSAGMSMNQVVDHFEEESQLNFGSS